MYFVLRRSLTHNFHRVSQNFWQAYDCHLVNQRTSENGEVFITDQSLSFSTEDMDHRRIVKFSIPLRQILCIRKAVIRTKAAHKDEAPVLYTLPEQEDTRHHHHHKNEPDGYQGMRALALSACCSL